MMQIFEEITITLGLGSFLITTLILVVHSNDRSTALVPRRSSRAERKQEAFTQLETEALTRLPWPKSDPRMFQLNSGWYEEQRDRLTPRSTQMPISIGQVIVGTPYLPTQVCCAECGRWHAVGEHFVAPTYVVIDESTFVNSIIGQKKGITNDQ